MKLELVKMRQGKGKSDISMRVVYGTVRLLNLEEMIEAASQCQNVRSQEGGVYMNGNK